VTDTRRADPVDDGLDVHRDDERGLVVVDGEVDLTTIDRFEEHLLDACHRASQDLVVDLAATTFLSARGCAVLALCQQELAGRRRRLVVRGAGRLVRRALELYAPPRAGRR
jgi:anti-anti-sigma factor